MEPTESEHWLAEQLAEQAAFLGDQAALIEGLIRAGEKVLDGVDLHNYQSLHRFAQELALGWSAQAKVTEAASSPHHVS